MLKRLLIITCLLSLALVKGQSIYYKNPDSVVVRHFSDTAQRVLLVKQDSNALLRSQFNYVLKFYPKMLVKNIKVRYKKTVTIASARPQFSSIFKAPVDRVYKVTLSSQTRSTLDSVMISNLGFNAQLGLVATQVSRIEDFSTGGFLDFLGWYFRQLSRRARNKMGAEDEQRTLEVGLGYQLLALNTENEKKLQIDKWQSTRGYASYLKYTKGKAMQPPVILSFISDLPVYVTQTYK